ncbi:MAG: glycosyltransferase [Bacilli bacterium]|nr:glycosyltransferase [Bacilli bacterium]
MELKELENIKFSVLMSLYIKDKPLILKEALDSIINQTIVPSEIVIIEDGPISEEVENLLFKYRTNYRDLIKVYAYKENKGLGYALNFGINKCENEIIARMDSDDISVTDRFEKELNKLIEDNLDMVGSNCIEFIDSISNVASNRTMPETNEEIYKYAKKRNPFIHPSMMFKKSLILKAGNFRSVHLCEDYDMWFRCFLENAKCYNIQENLVFMRVSKDFYKRRGGLKYYKSVKSCLKNMKKAKFITTGEYLKTIIPRFIVYLAPNFIREMFYKKKLRG